MSKPNKVLACQRITMTASLRKILQPKTKDIWKINKKNLIKIKFKTVKNSRNNLTKSLDKVISNRSIRDSFYTSSTLLRNQLRRRPLMVHQASVFRPQMVLHQITQMDWNCTRTIISTNTITLITITSITWTKTIKSSNSTTIPTVTNAVLKIVNTPQRLMQLG